jgi:hypothetical protein
MPAARLVRSRRGEQLLPAFGFASGVAGAEYDLARFDETKRAAVASCQLFCGRCAGFRDVERVEFTQEEERPR